MAVKNPHIRGMKHEDFKDNEYIESLVEELNAAGANIVVGKLDQLINWGRANSLWPLCFGTSCCAIEFMCLGAARYDMARYGAEVARNSPRQADYIMVQGTIVNRMAPSVRAAGRTPLRDCCRRLCGERRSFQKLLLRGSRSRQDSSCGCVYPGLSSPSRGTLLWTDAAATQD